MAQGQDARSADLRMDPEGLYLEEIFTDRRVGTIRRMTPVDGQGAPDRSQPVTYTGETQVVTPVGTLPIAFEIDAASLDEAAKKFGDLAKAAIERTMKELQEMRRQAASSIVIPQGGMPPGGMPGGGGSIQMP